MFFPELRSNPLTKMKNEATALTRVLNKIYALVKWKLKVPNAQIPQLYALPKIHKPGDAMRPIISSINAPTYRIEKFLVEEFKTPPVPPGKNIKNSFEFVEKLKTSQLAQMRI